MNVLTTNSHYNPVIMHTIIDTPFTVSHELNIPLQRKSGQTAANSYASTVVVFERLSELFGFSKSGAGLRKVKR